MSDIVKFESLEQALRQIADALSHPTSTEQLAIWHDIIKSYETNFEHLRNAVKQRLEVAVREDGEVVTDKGTRRLEAGDWALELRPRNTGIDSRKLEAMCRSQGLDPNICMDATISFKANAWKLEQAVNAGYLTREDVAACKADEAYTLYVKPLNKESNDE